MSRELLEKAAKAAGLIVQKNTEVVNADDRFIGIKVRDTERDKYRLWNPLTDDGDAFRLAVKLRISVMQPDPADRGNVLALYSRDGTSEPRGSDPYAATRLAIIRAAAMGEKPC